MHDTKTENSRLISVAHERVYCACHHDFEGCTPEQAAYRMAWPLPTVYRLLKELEELAPQLFPILTRRQVKVRDMVNEGMTNAQIALVLAVSKSTVCNVLQSLRKKGALPVQTTGITVLSYEGSMDNNIKEKF